MSRRQTRRDFLKQSAVAGAGFFALAGLTPGVSRAANERIRIAGIGVGGKGRSDIEQAANHGDVVAICDIDEHNLGSAFEYLNKKGHSPHKFFDYREMLDKMGKSIDAVTVSTPDHTHASASLMAMNMGKHVYCQKPLTHDVAEARQMRETAKKMKVCTQMGNQGTASNGLRRAVEAIRGGIIGAVSEAHVWTNRPIWPQAPQVMARPKGTFEVPKHVHWDLFLGTAPERPYAPGYHPFSWRGWWDFGTGALGDMACHTANMAFLALKLHYPTSISAEAGDLNPETCPSWASVVYQFPARDGMPPAKLYWYEGKTGGKNVLPSPELVKGQGDRNNAYAVFFKDNKWWFRDIEQKDPKKQVKNVSSGSFLVGEKAVLFSPDDYGETAFIVTADGVERLKGDPEKLPRNGGGDEGMKAEWIEAINQNKPEHAMSNFGHAGVFAETVLLGNVAIRAAKPLDWDGENLRVTNDTKAMRYVKRVYRKGWTL